MQTDNAADLNLLQAYVTKGDAAAFNTLMQRYTGLVYNTCLRVLGDRALAEDATQETFYRLMRKPEQVTKCVPAWLHRAATHLCLDMLRSNNARKTREQNYHAELERKRARTPEQWDQVLPYLDQALSDLPDETRTILVDHFLMGKSQRELAVEYGYSPATMSRRMKQAMEVLRQQLSKRGLVLAVSPLMMLLTAYEAHAVPIALATQLGKLTIFTSTTSAAAAASTTAATTGLWLKTGGIIVGGLIIGLATISFTGIGNIDPNSATDTVLDDHIIQPTKRQSQQIISEINTSKQPTRSITSNETIQITPMLSHLQSDIICLISAPTTDATHLTVTYADTHTVTLPIDQVRTAIEKQTGKPFDQVIKSSPRVTYPTQ
ncbi:RNA polymerase sigma factor [Poriferisphaera sp. WC338]|uniref:RNA polymerase sigma factor n=1 Tax=Poriferisphaera sp. WC338 TaxID=3425129 RepID=UPI003D819F3B